MRLPDVKLPRALAASLCFIPVIPMIFIPGLGELALFAMAAILLLMSADARRATLRWHDGSATKEILIGLSLGVGFALFSLFLLDPALGRLLQAQTDLSSFDAVRGNAKAALTLLVMGWVIGGLLEEVTNRGFLIGWGSKLLGPKSTIPLLILSSAAFGAAHLYQGPVGAVSTGLTGLYFGVIYLWRRETLLAAIMAHGIFDTVGIAAIYLGVNLA